MFSTLLERKLSRRKLLAQTVVGGSALALQQGFPLLANAAARKRPAPPFKEILQLLEENHSIAEGYAAQTLLRWGDALWQNSPVFNPHKVDADAQELQFGYNNDYIAFMPLPKGSDSSTHGLLCVNHEYTNASLMFPKAKDRATEKEILRAEMAAHGHSVIEVKKEKDQWNIVKGFYNRRFHANTSFAMSGPAAGHDRLKTSADTSGKSVMGTLNNCAGGITPWGTVLVAEENVDGYFKGKSKNAREKDNHKRMGIGGAGYGWHTLDSRFDVEKEPNEPNRFGWVWEFDPYNPTSVPTKRTALGRFKHEGATPTLNHDGRVVVYSGDDEKFQFIYKFVSAKKYNPKKPDEHKTLLDDGILYAAKFDEESITWLPLAYGTAPLDASNGFTSQADVLIETRRAAELMGATPMDRPEDIEVSPTTGRVYVSLTNNTSRDKADAANPRPSNKHGHIIELTPPTTKGDKKDHAATRFEWDIFLLAGNPADADDAAFYQDTPSEHGWLSCPDNLGFDPKGNLWITTDGQPHTIDKADGIYVAACSGPARGVPFHFYNAPRGAEVTGPCFTPDASTLFISIQHPADGFMSSFSSPSTRWPDFDDKLPPRPSVIAITRTDSKTKSLI